MKPCGSCKYHAGMLRHTVELQARTLTDDGVGGKKTVWTTEATIRAEVMPLSAAEQYRLMRLQNPATHRITIRYRAGVTGDKRIKWGTRYFNIEGVINVEERNRWLELNAREGVPM